jgi:hypothetical protein
MWQIRIDPSACNVHQTNTRGTLRRAWVPGALCVDFLVPSATFRRTCLPARRFTIACTGKHNCTHVDGNSPSRISSPIFFNSSSGVTVAKPIFKMHIGVSFTSKRHVYGYLSLRTYHVCCLTHCRCCYGYMSTPTNCNCFALTATDRTSCRWHFKVRTGHGTKSGRNNLNSWDTLYISLYSENCIMYIIE